MELTCTAGNAAALLAAIDAGADAVCVELRDRTLANAFPDRGFSGEELQHGIAHAHARRRKVYLVVDSCPDSAGLASCLASVDKAAEYGCDALIAAEMAVLDYAARRHPRLPRHLSVRGSATASPALRYMHERFGVSRAVLPRMLSVQQVERLCASSPVALETFAFGNLCMMAEGHCRLSSYVAGVAQRHHGPCSPNHFSRRPELDNNDRRGRAEHDLAGHFATHEAQESPALCTDRFEVDGEVFHALDEPGCVNTLELLPRLAGAGVAALRIECDQGSVSAVTRIWRETLDRYASAPLAWRAHAHWQRDLAQHAGGRQTSLGTAHRRRY